MNESYVIFFFLLLALAFVSGVLFSRTLVPAVFSLFGFLISIAGIFASLSAHSATFAQILLYVGGVMVLVAFVLFLNPEPKSAQAPVSFLRFHFGKSIVVLGLALAAFIWIPFREWNAFFLQYKADSNQTRTEKDLGETGKILAADFAFEFEMLGLLMLAGLVLCGWYLKSNQSIKKT